ncbi:hypothetical protein [Streptomyces broussonetiae]|uniref:DUF4367 domain-containing protein n=1 Tax=Streptomyces broussonetiae TaxID=2686304 RepID=A0ABV5EM79_9ACTN
MSRVRRLPPRRSLPSLLPPLLVVAALLLTGCGKEKAPSADGATASTAEIPAPTGTAVSEELADRATALGIAPEHVYVTAAPGFALAQQSVGVSGDDGFSASYFSRSAGTHFTLTVDRGSMTAASCPGQAVGDLGRGPTECERDGDAWYRDGRSQHEYLLAGDGQVIRLSADSGVPRATLRAAVEAVHRPSGDELDALLPPATGTGPTAPVERGDLPSEGDGAPNNDVGVGG